MKKITILALLLTWGTASWAGENEKQETEEQKQVAENKRTPWNKYLHGYQYQARVAYNLGGTALSVFLLPSVHCTAIRCNLTSVWVSMLITHFQANGDSLEVCTLKTRA